MRDFTADAWQRALRHFQSVSRWLRRRPPQKSGCIPQDSAIPRSSGNHDARLMTITAPPPAETDHALPSPEPIMRLAFGFMAAKHLFAANDLGLFEALGEGPTDLHGLAARTGLTARATRISADAMVALGLLERLGDLYANTETAATFLAGGSPADLRPLLRFWDKISFPAWAELAGALARGPKREICRPRPRPAIHRRVRHRGIHRSTLARPAGGRRSVRQPSAPRHRRWHRLLVHRGGTAAGRR